MERHSSALETEDPKYIVQIWGKGKKLLLFLVISSGLRMSHLINIDPGLKDNLTGIIEDFDNTFFIYNQPLNAVLIATYIPLFLIALTTNVLIILVVGRYRCLRRYVFIRIFGIFIFLST